MPWVYLDDGFPEHPKVIAAGGDASWLWVCALAYCNRNLTEGSIPKVVVPRLSDRKGPERLAKRLVEAGLWEDKGDSYYVHDYHEVNQSAMKATAEKRARSEHAKKAAEARWTNAPPDARAMPEQCPEHMPEHDGSTCPSNAQPMLADAPARERARGRADPKPLSPSKLGFTDGLAKVAGIQTETEKIKATAICERIHALLGVDDGRPPPPAQVGSLVWHAAEHVDLGFIDMTIGSLEELDSPPRRLSYVAKTIRDRAAQQGIPMPTWKPNENGIGSS